MIKGILSLLINLLIILILLHAIGSWIPRVRESKPYELLDRLVSPLLEPIRKIAPPTAGFDVSPLILLLLLYLIKHLFKL
ncbi:MAG: YggT family protein [Aquificaceae bacterium]|nr:YggT family protein [Aquificaceae bacterium]MCS7195731.1 YggT family protein [Aquificaceae bacterium]MCX7989911.1 YggT family protein [Aquificaceae bacterium]MDW8032435.1 YggT family protein [Aquificaceae bacterium]MDW8294675.1 YggT family protein [Aquificaceae bacterium]